MNIDRLKANKYSKSLVVFILELNENLTVPYKYLPSDSSIFRTSSIKKSLKHLVQTTPDIVFLSASYEAEESIEFLEALKNASFNQLIPLVVVVDLSHPINFIPGTTWGGRLAVIDSQANPKELYEILERI